MAVRKPLAPRVPAPTAIHPPPPVDRPAPTSLADVLLAALRAPVAALLAPVAVLLAPVAGIPGLPSTVGELAAQQVDPERYGQLEFRHIGPVGNRVSAVAGVRGDPTTYYAGAASGGVWRTEDGGFTWEPVFDEQPVHSIGALAVAPSDPNVVWAGTGEPFIRSNVSIGNGVWRSTDGGESWTHAGLEGTGRIARIIVHPTDPDVVYAAAVGHGYAPQPERGIYRTTDGGESWERVLFVDEETGASDLVMDPNNPRILFAGTWQLSIRTWGRVSGGPGSGIHVTRDGGDTWERLEGEGLPEKPVGKIALCMTPEDSERIYALIETGDGVPWDGEETDTGELWRSEDGGESWTLATHDRDLGGRQAYYTRCAVSPDDADELYFLAADYNVSLDGGKTTEELDPGEVPVWDHHDMWIDPEDADRMIVAGDGGVAVSENRGKSWFRVQLPVAQLYHVTVDDDIPYHVYTNRQDGPSLRGPSRSRTGGLFGSGIPRGAWHEVGGGESGFATPDTVEDGIVWSSTSGYGPVSGIVVRYDEARRQYRHVEVWPEASIGWPAEDVRYRFQWTFPLLISPHDHQTVYVGSQHVHRTTNGGQSWEVVSPDLSTADTTRMGPSGGLTPDNLGVEYCCVVYALDESPVEEGVLWAGTNDGLVHVSRDGGGSWTDVTANIPDLPPDGVVRNIDASKWDAGKAYLTVERHQVGDFAPYVYRTEDYGGSWTRITDGIPESPLAYARNVREDPEREGLLYLGTENALYVSFDDGGRWQPLMTNLPPAPMYWLTVEPRFSDLVVGTYGRGIWILDDVTPLRQLDAEVTGSAAHLFEPRDAYRFRPITPEMAMFDDPSAGEDPPGGPAGTPINYWLAEAPEGEVTLHVLDAAGDTLRTLEGKKEAGINRVWWNLESDSTTRIELRTKPLYADWVELGDDGWRPAPEGGWTYVVPPGTYTVALEVDGEPVEGPAGRRELRVLRDPHSAGSEADIEAQMAMVRELYADANAAAALANRIEWVRRQLADLEPLLEEREEEELAAAADSLDERLVEVEGELLQLRLTGTGQDVVRWPMKLVGRIGWLAAGVGEADFPPTDQAREVQALLEERLAGHRRAFEGIVSGELAEFNRRLVERDLTGIVTATP